MSTTIDQRVVEMRFDNKQFEQATATTMSTLDKLKAKLNFSGASKGLEDVGVAAKNVNMNGLSNAVETVHAKFSALQVMGVTALSNITNSAVNAGKRIVSSLTIDPIKTGSSEYELKMNSVQTIMASTGESIETVNQYLEELNKYSDQTIYSFSDMTSNIGKFTNAGVKLEDAVLAIKGISNAAAVSGANTNEASRAMYNFSQALSAGYVKLIDWKSIENANMATVEFKNQLLEAAVAAGTLEKTSDGMYKVLTSNAAGSKMEQTISATQNFNDSLNYQWMTSEALIETLKDYADETTEIGAKATEAATKVKTFTQLRDTLKESAQSGWAQSWEIIVGDLEEAKKVLTKISDIAGNIIGKSAEKRNNLLMNVFGSKWDNLIKKINEAGISTENFEKALEKSVKKEGKSLTDLVKKYKTLKGAIESGEISTNSIIEAIKSFAGVESKAADTTKDLADKLEYYQKIVNEVWRGDWANSDTGRYEKLAKAGYDYITVQKLVNKTVDGHKLTLEDLIEVQAEMSDAQLQNIGYTEEQVTAIRQLAEEAEKTGTPIHQLIEDLTKPSGRELFFESITNTLKAFGQVLDIIAKAWGNVFSDNDMADGLYGALEALAEFTESLALGEEAAANFQKICEGAFSALRLTWFTTSASINSFIKLLDAVLGLFGTDLIELAAGLAGVITQVANWIEENTMFMSQISKFAEIIYEVIKGVYGLAKAFLELDLVRESIEKFKEVVLGFFGDFANGLSTFSLDNIIENIRKAFEQAIAWVKSLNDSKNLGKDLILGLANGIWAAIKHVGNTIKEVGLYLIETFCSILGIQSPSKVFFALGGFIIAGLIAGLVAALKNFAPEIYDSIGSFVSTMWNTLTSGLGNIVGFFKKIGSAVIGYFKSIFSKENVTAITGTMSVFFGYIKDFFKGLDFGKILAAAIGVGTLLTLRKLIDVLDKIVSPVKAISSMASSIGGLADTINAKIKGDKWEKKSNAILNMAKAIGILAVSVVLLAGVHWTDLLKAGVAIVVLAGVITRLAFVATKLQSAGSYGGIAAFIVSIGASILIIATALKTLSKIDAEGAETAISMLTTVFLGLMGLISVIALAVALDGSGSLGKAGMMFLGLSASLLIMTTVMKQLAKLDESAVKNGMTVISALGLLMALLIKVSGSVGPYASKAGTMLLKMSASLLIMVGVIKIASMLDKGEIKRGIIAVAAAELLFAGILVISKIAAKTGEHASKTGGLIFKTSIALLALMGVMKIASGFTKNEILKALTVITALELLMAGLIATLRVAGNAGQHAAKIGTMLLLITTSLLAMTAVIFILSELDVKGMWKAVGVISVLEVLFMGLIAVTHFAKDSAGMKSVLITLTVMVTLLVGALIGLSFVPIKELMSATAAISAILLSLSALIASFKFFNTGDKWYRNVLTLASMTLVIAALGGVILMLRKCDPLSAIGAAASIGILLTTMALAFKVMYTDRVMSKEKMTRNAITLGAMTLVVGALATIIGLLTTHASGLDQAIPAAVALGILITTLSASMRILDNVKPINNGIVLTMGLLGIIIAELAAVLWGMQALGVDASLKNVAALSVLLVAITGVLGLLDLFNFNASSIDDLVVGIAGLAAMVVPLGLFVLVLRDLQGVDVATSNVDALIKLATVTSLLLIPLSLVGAAAALTGGATLLGIAALAAMAWPLTELIDVLKLMSGVTDATKNANLLTDLMETLSNVLIKVSIAAPLALLGVASLGVLTLFMVGMGALAIAVGALMDKNRDIERFLDKGVPVLNKLASALGGFVGSIIGGFIGGIGAGVMSWLPLMGTYLSDFMDKLGGFLEGAEGITEDVYKGTGYLVKSILSLTVADFITGITSLGGISFVSLAINLSDFMEELGGFIKGAENLKPEMVEGVKLLADTILILTTADFIDGLINPWWGQSSLEGFASQLPDFAKAISEFAGGLTNLDDTTLNKTKIAAGVLKTLAEASTSIPNSGGVLGWLVGNNDISTFGGQLEGLGSTISGFAESVSELDDDDIKSTKNAAEIIKVLANAGSAIENEGGMWADFWGDNTLATFGANLPSLATNLVSFASTLTGGDINFSDDATKSAIENVADTVMTLAKAGNTIDNEGGTWAEFWGDNNLATFSANLPPLATNLRTFVENLGTFNDTQVKTVGSASQAIQALANMGASSKDFNSVIDGFGSNFGTNLTKFAGKITSFYTTLSEIGVQTITAATRAVNNVTTLVKNLCNIDTESATTVCHTLEILGQNGVKGLYDSLTSKDTEGDAKEAVTTFISYIVKAAEAEDSVSSIKDGFINAVKDAAKAVKTEDNYEKFSDVGKYCVEGLAAGLKNSTKIAKDAAEAVMAAAIAAAEEEAGIKSPSRVFRTIAAFCVQGFADGMNKGVKKVSSVSKNLAGSSIKAVAYALDVKDGVSEEFKELGETTTESFGEGIADGTTAVVESVEAVVEAVEEAAPSLVANYAEVLSEYQRFIDGFDGATETLMDSADIFSAVQKKEEETTSDEITQNLIDQMKRLDEYSEIIGSLNERIEDVDFKALINNMGIDSIDNLRALNKMTDEELTTYIQLYYDKLELAKTVATQEAMLRGEVLSAESAYWVELLEANKNGVDALRYQGMSYLDFQEDVLSQTVDLYENYTNELKSATDSFMGATSLFSEVEEEEKVSGQTLYRNLENQVKQLKEYDEVMQSLKTKLSEREFGDELMEALSKMDVGSLNELKALNNMTDHELTLYANMYGLKYETAKTNATNQLAELKSDTEKQLSDIFGGTEVNLDSFAEVFDGSFESINTYLTNQGVDLASGYISGFAEGVTENMYIVEARSQAMALAISKAAKSEEVEAETNAAGETLVTELADAIESSISEVETAGSNVITGLVDSLTSNDSLNSVISAGKDVGGKLLGGIKEALGINSPSKETYELGEYSIAGFTNALYDYADSSYVAGEEIGESAKAGLSDAISKIKTFITDDVDVQPTITPVLDLTNVRSGVNAISGMFGFEPSIGVMSNIGAINSMMSQNGQNGVSEEIVSAIDRLRKDIGNMDRNTYNINGITYDDGSAVADAMEALVRAARIERRT